ncbi:MAG TPA: methyltransferase domain-containing protein [Anaeromyxobacteraceae bacterium]|nr:methyltransferase domain-containing protein [Anaeromyxobacteraceae bacterium]
MARRHGEEGWERALAEQLAAGVPVPDARFDRLFEESLRLRAGLHFTPVAVAARAAAWLTEGGATEVADLGAGAGKLCLVGAATTAARFTGIERRPWLVEVARDLARRLGLDRAQFVVGDLRRVPLGRYQAFYVYDPFSEPGAEPDEWLDASPPTEDRAADVACLLDRLGAAPAGTRLAWLCGLGGPTPPGYRLVREEPVNERGDLLQCWER